MSTADWPALRGWLMVPAAIVVLSGLAAGCSSGKPAYCTAASQLKTDVSKLGDITVNVNDLGSVKTAVSKVQADAKTLASDTKSAYPSHTSALQNSLTGVEAAVKSASATPFVTTVAAVVSAIAR